MAEVQHKSLPDSELHDAKGVISAGSGMVYAANGAGTGVWKRVTADMLSGIAGNGQAGQIVTLDGSGGFSAQAGSSYLYGASLLTAATPGQSDVVVKFAPTNNWTQTIASNISLQDNTFIFANSGIYHMTFTMSKYNTTEATDVIRTFLLVDLTGSAIVAMANDSVSSVTVSAIFPMAANGRVQLHKSTAATGIPGVLGQYAVHRIGG